MNHDASRIERRAREIRTLLDEVRRNSPTYQDMQRLMNRYAIERFLFRLGSSKYGERLILKGAMLLVLYLPHEARSTRDADFLGFGRFTEQSLKELLTEVCNEECDDGLVFNTSGITVEPAGADRGYPGYAVIIPTRLREANCDIHLDIAVGEAVEPAPQPIEYPTILNMPRPHLRACALETLIAEKFQAITYLGMSNTRLKDYYDLSEVALRCRVSGTSLRMAVAATFAQRGTPLPMEPPIGLTDAFYASRRKQKDWSAFLTRHALPAHLPLGERCISIERLVMPVARAIAAGKGFPLTWNDGAWR